MINAEDHAAHCRMATRYIRTSGWWVEAALEVLGGGDQSLKADLLSLCSLSSKKAYIDPNLFLNDE